MPKQKTNKNTKINYKAKYKNLEKKYQNLQIENELLRVLNKPTREQKIKILDDFYIWANEEELNLNDSYAYFAYKKKLLNADHE